METNILDYVFIAILLIIMEEKKVHLVTFHSYIFKATELNYNIYNKKLLIIFEAFYIWYYYLKGLELPIDIIIDYKIWNTFQLLKFSPTIKQDGQNSFSSSILLIHREDFYLGEKSTVYTSVNSYNLHFHSQLTCNIFLSYHFYLSIFISNYHYKLW